MYLCLNIAAISRRFSILEEDSATKREAKSMVNLLYALTEVDNVTQEGKFVFQGAAAYSTNSTGKLSFLNNMMGIFKGEGDINTGDHRMGMEIGTLQTRRILNG